jgi:hypothetical protein
MTAEGQKTIEHFDKADREARLARKRLFIGLVTGSAVTVCLGLVALWAIPYIGFSNIHPVVPHIAGALFTALILFIAWASLGLVLAVRGIRLPFQRRLHGVSIKIFLPLMTLMGRLFGISKERVRASFIKVNNEIVLNEAGRYEPEDVLLLMPHCLQKSRCTRRLTYNINNCKRCGECPIAGLLDFSERYGVHLAIATGGTIARRIVVQVRPKLIIAVACERGLSSGIQDTYPIPTFGVLNERPHGPCLDTNVQLPMVEEALQRFLKRLPADKPQEETQAPRAARGVAIEA